MRTPLSTSQMADGSQWVTLDDSFARTLQALRKYAEHSSVPILLEGASGTGKSSMARAIHDASPRRERPFHDLTLSSLDDSLAGSDLFGHVPGAFTDARTRRPGAFLSANGGSLFLDELGKASSRIQMKLLGSIESGVVVQQGADKAFRVDVRIIAASNVAIDRLVEEGSFLPDLAARFGMFRVRLPNLCDRSIDIPILVQQILERRWRAFGYQAAPLIDEELMVILQQARWPLNIRQLDAALQRLMVDSHGARVLTASLWSSDLDEQVGGARRRSTRDVSPSEVCREATRRESRAALAHRLGVSEATVYRRLRQADRRAD